MIESLATSPTVNLYQRGPGSGSGSMAEQILASPVKVSKDLLANLCVFAWGFVLFLLQAKQKGEKHLLLLSSCCIGLEILPQRE